MKYEKLAKEIIENVGGRENINSVVHCITRLRFKLKDESKANTEVLKDMDDVVTVMKSAGQYQVVIGNQVPDVYKAVVEVGGFSSNAPVEEESGDTNLFNRFIDVISSIFTPILGVLAATGMIKGLNALFVALGWLDTTSGTYQILNAVGDSLFYFFPIFLGYTAIKKFGGSPFIGMAIGAALVYPALSGVTAGEPLYTLFSGTIFESPVFITFLGIPVILMSYASSVIPIILAAFFAAKVENGFKKVVPDVVKAFVVPFATLLVVVPVTFMLIGPIATWAGQLLGQGTMFIFNLSPIIAGLFIGGLWQVFVIFGLHWGLVPIAINNLAVQGSDPILGMMFAASFAQIGAVLAVYLKIKNQKLKTLSVPAFISGIFGVTEPAIYGITLPLKKPFIMSCIGGAVGGAILGFAKSSLFMVGGLGIFGIPTYIHPTEGLNFAFWAVLVSITVAFIIGFVLTYLFGLSKEKTAADAPSPKVVVQKDEALLVGNQIVASPMQGVVKELSELEDAAFSSGALGKGVAIEPTEGKLYAPVSGTVTALFSTKHAVGITADSGAEILIHIGMNTVQLNGKHFTAHVEQGAQIEKGQLLIEFDIEAIKQAGYEVVTPVVITDTEKYTNVNTTTDKKIKWGEPLISLEV
ncbi:PTS system beta-glucoside-specific IIA component (Glc family) /PTS system beta-glucoside-specific IIB component (Glc family) /PTS system beta-glucoside-specific IIC component (Glc family) [Planomicrobium soli]|uniref:PTS system beta-glucoside-specific IIA component (Glc family) /PTS system beta-glucoside-specific IIB component (Glc family) /PTS system beta-glucoside-specific IIC component (Glc family) n=1 Tax=Planomicrobium soli TaxID=1176648 RepID=A0A2P8GQR3_9BACL|nr:beta-glucoside-specific PTS transporter subunit IIABC [Planomicrobium soli]PSL36311.1 PTS system beta-glucoside-specific IIA component (Glc family) /PTS system beta-glucoside-specific IIB component (Glc family) /PTS system beta-glucoside-specific IIC component (Glc family) [Planomicrobium soli]